MKRFRSKDNPWRAVAMLGGIGVDLGVCMLAGFWLGDWFSDYRGGEPIWIALGMMLGFILGIVSVVLIIRRVMQGGSNG
ncbi:AtpZ/AtpI family protein [Paenibacillus sp. GD4]|jgi:ATP synthase protein I|uniref:AtpZ/AtpI family protein n=1 Tax=Paenibacillus TaxID=44249 RepID=UPI0025432732|nr:MULTISPECIES: AtpZ/AtpI family protein [Paenibacillus]MDQ1911224.1 AtpZ/AtpI family protein [Paenibacillus sp. GD4]